MEYDGVNKMIGGVFRTTMKFLTVVLSLCGGQPSISIDGARGMMQKVNSSLSFCTKNKFWVNPIAIEKHIDICPNSLNSCNVDNLRAAVIEKVPNIKNYRHVLYILPKEVQCTFAGLGSIGPCSGSQQCEVWINGYYPNYTGVYVHEIGHNLGLRHAKYNGYSYDDMTDIMGACCDERCFNAVHLYKLNIQKPKHMYNYPLLKDESVTLGKNEYIMLVTQTNMYFLHNRQRNKFDQVPKQFGNGLNVYVQLVGQSEDSELLYQLRTVNSPIEIEGKGFVVTLLNQTKSGVITLQLSGNT